MHHTLYHISPERDIQVFRGSHDVRFPHPGLFLAPKKAILQSWAVYVQNKKGREHALGARSQNLTLYKVRVLRGP